MKNTANKGVGSGVTAGTVESQDVVVGAQPGTDGAQTAPADAAGGIAAGPDGAQPGPAETAGGNAAGPGGPQPDAPSGFVGAVAATAEATAGTDGAQPAAAPVSASGRDAAWYAARIACLEAFMTEARSALFRRTVAMRTRYVTVLAENMYHGQNAAALIRHCEAFGVQRMHTVETLCAFEPNAAVSRGTDRWVDVVRHPSTADALAALKGAGYRIVATTPHREDCTPATFDVAAGPFALVFGTEHAGISDEVIAVADCFLRIPMCGMVESLNVSASAAILLCLLTERVRDTVSGWRMDEALQAEVLYRWMATSVGDSARILRKRFGDDDR